MFTPLKLIIEVGLRPDSWVRSADISNPVTLHSKVKLFSKNWTEGH